MKYFQKNIEYVYLYFVLSDEQSKAQREFCSLTSNKQ